MSLIDTKTPMRWELSSPAKLNLSLRVISRRDDTYHNLCSLFAFCGWYDWLVLDQLDGQNTIACHVDGPQAPINLRPGENLAVRAYDFACKHFGDLPAIRLQLTKNIPNGAGLGGGSSNAAAILRWALEFHQRSLPSASSKLVNSIRTELGADVYPILEGQARLWTGTGDHPGPILSLKSPLYVLVVFPNDHVATSSIFSALDDYDPPVEPDDCLWHEALSGPNSLQAPAQSQSTAIKKLLQSMEKACQTTFDQQDDALKVQMTGSGSACFALFWSKERAREAAQHPELVRLPHYAGPLLTSAWQQPRPLAKILEN